MDIAGIGLLGCSLLSGMLAATILGEPKMQGNVAFFVVLIAVALVTLVLFFRHIHRTDAPFINPRLIHGPSFGAVNLVNLIYSGFIVGALTLVPLYATNRYNIGVVGSGSLLTAQGAAAMICSILAVMALRRTGYRMPLYVGSGITILGLLLLAIAPPFGLSPYVWLAFAAFLVGAGSGIINPSMRNAGLQLAPESSSMLAALRTLSLQIGSIATVSVAAAVLAHQTDMGLALAWIFGLLALIRLLALWLIRYVPEQRGAW
jgi:MFS family permease